MKMPTMGMMKGRKGFADGGMPDAMNAETPPIDVKLSGGEYYVSPDVVAQIGGGSYDKGHDILDAMVAQIRQKTIKTLKRLPKPKKR